MSRVFEAFRAAQIPLPDGTETAADIDEDRDRESLLQQVMRLANQPTQESRIVSSSDIHNPVQEQFRYIEDRLRELRRTQAIGAILITSAAPAEGKTVVAANLAVTLASGSAPVLLIDGDMRASRSHDIFGLGKRPGLADVLEGRTLMEEALVYLEALKIYYLPSGLPSTSPADLLQSERMRALLENLEDFDWVVLDSPPIGAFADAQCLARRVDTTVLVVRSGATTRHEFDESIAALKGRHVAGVVLNACDQRRREYYYSYYRTGRKGKSLGK